MSSVPRAAAVATTAGVRIEVRVTPRAAKPGFGGVRDGRVVVRVSAPPVDDAANDAVMAMFAKALRVPKRAVAIAAGATSRNKTIAVAGISLGALGDLLWE